MRTSDLLWLLAFTALCIIISLNTIIKHADLKHKENIAQHEENGKEIQKLVTHECEK